MIGTPEAERDATDNELGRSDRETDTARFNSVPHRRDRALLAVRLTDSGSK